MAANFAAHHQNNASPSNVAANYQVKITPNGSSTPSFQGTWKDLGGTAVYDDTDTTHRTILLLPPSTTEDLFASGTQIQVTVFETVVDPAGNPIDPAKNTLITTAN